MHLNGNLNASRADRRCRSFDCAWNVRAIDLGAKSIDDGEMSERLTTVSRMKAAKSFSSPLTNTSICSTLIVSSCACTAEIDVFEWVACRRETTTNEMVQFMNIAQLINYRACNSFLSRDRSHNCGMLSRRWSQNTLHRMSRAREKKREEERERCATQAIPDRR